MKLLINTLLSVFFAIAISVHVYYVIESDGKPFWWHCIYYITYGTCWWMLFSKNKYRSLIYTGMAVFPFISHVYYGYKHIPAFDSMFWICVLVCLMLCLGFFWIKYQRDETTTID